MEPIRIILEVFVESDKLDYVAAELGKLPEVVYLYEVTGKSDIVALIRTDSTSAFRDLLVHKILHIRGLRSTTSAVILKQIKNASRTFA